MKKYKRQVRSSINPGDEGARAASEPNGFFKTHLELFGCRREKSDVWAGYNSQLLKQAPLRIKLCKKNTACFIISYTISCIFELLSA